MWKQITKTELITLTLFKIIKVIGCFLILTQLRLSLLKIFNSKGLIKIKSGASNCSAFQNWDKLNMKSLYCIRLRVHYQYVEIELKKIHLITWHNPLHSVLTSRSRAQNFLLRPSFSLNKFKRIDRPLWFALGRVALFCNVWLKTYST